MSFVYLNHTLLAADQAVVSVQDRGFKYGDGVYETIGVHGDVPYQFELHIERLASALKAIRIDFDTTGLKDQCRQLLHKNQCENGILRIQITRGSGSRGFLPFQSSAPTVFIETLPMPNNSRHT